jgi:SAM-dependent methyltransferase
MAEEVTYPFQRARAPQQQRLLALEEVLDAGSIGHLDARGVRPGWACLEVGAGGGSIAAWLCERVGRSGTVVAADLDPTPLRELLYPNLRVEVLDVQRDPLPSEAFDLIHMRLLLAWLSEPRAALRRLVAALKPGGWLVAEEMDFASLAADPRIDAEDRGAFERAAAAHYAFLIDQHAFDPWYGRRVAGDLVDAGLADVDFAGRSSMWRAGEPGGHLWRLTLEQLRDPLAASGLVTTADVDRAIELCADPRFSVLSPTTMAAWGRRPAS